MDKKISIIMDVIRNEPHVLLLQQNSEISVKAITEFGKSLVGKVSLLHENDLNQIKLILPPGFEATQFKGISVKAQVIFDSVFGESDLFDKTIIRNFNGSMSKKTFNERKSNNENWISRTSRTPSGQSLRRFNTVKEKIDIIDYKAKLFKSNAKRSEILNTLKSGKIGFNNETNSLVTRVDNRLSDFIKTKIINHIGSGGVRRFLKKQDDINFQNSLPNKRIARRIAFMADDPIERKKLNNQEKLTITMKSRLRKQV